MTDNTKELDIAQRIVEAMQRSSEPRPSALGQFKPDEDTVIGEVPEHLRHLYNLVDEVGNDAMEAARRYHEANKRHAAIHAIFFDSLRQHVPSDGNEYDGVKLCEGWQVVGFKNKKDEGEMGGLGELLAMAVMSGYR